jgi:glycine/D-amino acid oxidase-like deaminating enzyme
MRVCITGGGIAATTLAWRLAQRPEVKHLDILLGEDGRTDATELSGGVVRAYERDPEARRLATESLGELLSSTVLRAWSRYRESTTVYLRKGDGGLHRELDALEARLPGSAWVATTAKLAQLGWAGLPAGTVGVVERRGGYISATRLRSALVADLAARPNVRVVRAAAGAVAACADGTVTACSGRRLRTYDAVVVATGAWTPSVLSANGLPAAGLRTKAIRCATYAVCGRRPMPFADETSGLYGRPIADGQLMLGMATEEWDVVPGHRPATEAPHATAARIARRRMPWLQLGRVLTYINATDCYCDPPILALRPVAVEPGPIWTFTGGSGGSVKTALAASRQAAEQLLGARQPQHSFQGM